MNSMIKKCKMRKRICKLSLKVCQLVAKAVEISSNRQGNHPLVALLINNNNNSYHHLMNYKASLLRVPKAMLIRIMETIQIFLKYHLVNLAVFGLLQKKKVPYLKLFKIKHFH